MFIEVTYSIMFGSASLNVGDIVDWLPRRNKLRQIWWPYRDHPHRIVVQVPRISIYCTKHCSGQLEPSSSLSRNGLFALRKSLSGILLHGL